MTRMSVYEELAAAIIDIVSDAIEKQHPEIVIKGDNAALCGVEYYNLEKAVADLIEQELEV